MSQPYPVDRLLPAEIATAASQVLLYQRRPVFSWGWWWRRMLVFAPLVFVLVLYTGNDHGMFARDAMQGLAVAWRNAVSIFTFIGAGTLLATAVRHARLPTTFERVLIVLAVMAGFFLWDAASHWSNSYHARLMCEINGVPAQQCPDWRRIIDGTLLGALMQLSVPVGLYFTLGGGVALVSWGRERRAWVELQQRRERERLELKINQADARLSVLQAQIEPHFLFNTLASLRSLVRTEPQRAEATIDALVVHLRATLPLMRDEADSTLGRQIDICRSYLDVMCVRMGERLRYAIDVPREIADRPMPPLMLLSLVENAIKHGVEPAPGAHLVAIAACVDGRVLQMTVSDDGAGLREGLSTGVGLANIRAQLALRYGSTATLDLQNRAAGGAIATLRIPLQDDLT